MPLTKHAANDQAVRVVPQKTQRFLATGTIAIWAEVIYCTANTSTDSYDLFLPAAEECRGQTKSIYSTIANSKAVTVKARGSQFKWSNLTLDTDGDFAVLYSDGAAWHVIRNGIV